MRIIYLSFFQIFLNVWLKISKYFEVLFFVLENVKDIFFISNAQSIISTPTAISVRHKFKAHFISHGFKIFIHFIINEKFRVICKTIFKHCEHHSCKACNGLSWSFSEEVSGSFLELHFMIGDKSLMSRGYIDDVFKWASLFLNTDEDTRNFLRKIIFNKLIDDSHLVSIKKLLWSINRLFECKKLIKEIRCWY